jgi:hypothetical protein
VCGGSRGGATGPDGESERAIAGGAHNTWSGPALSRGATLGGSGDLELDGDNWLRHRQKEVTHESGARWSWPWLWGSGVDVPREGGGSALTGDWGGREARRGGQRARGWLARAYTRKRKGNGSGRRPRGAKGGPGGRQRRGNGERGDGRATREQGRRGVRSGGPHLEVRGCVGHAWNMWASRGEGKRVGPKGTVMFGIYSN